MTLLRWFESLQTGPGSFKNVTPRRPFLGPQDAKKARNSGLFSYWDHFVPVEMAGAEGLEPSARGFGVDVGKGRRSQERAVLTCSPRQVPKERCWFGAGGNLEQIRSDNTKFNFDKIIDKHKKMRYNT